MSASISEFSPNWTSAPGETIADVLTERGISIHEFADRMGQSAEEARELLEGRTAISIRTARLLSKVVGASVEFWIARDFQYREDAKRLEAYDQRWLKELPIGDMIKLGWLKPAPRPAEEMQACLKFFNVGSLAEWTKTYGRLHEFVPFRTSATFESRPAAIAAWIRQGEIEAERIECQEWNPANFRDVLSEIRLLTRLKDPSVFIPQLQALCARCGVAVVIVRAPNGCRASGAVKFLNPTKALLLLSFRYLSDDQFWFSFFHEAAHLVLHGDKSVFIEGLEVDGALTPREEQEANEFASATLVPAEFRERMFRLPGNHRQVIAFARELRIAPGIVVGQLQHFGRLRRNRLNSLKRRFKWSD